MVAGAKSADKYAALVLDALVYKYGFSPRAGASVVEENEDLIRAAHRSYVRNRKVTPGLLAEGIAHSIRSEVRMQRRMKGRASGMREPWHLPDRELAAYRPAVDRAKRVTAVRRAMMRAFDDGDIASATYLSRVSQAERRGVDTTQWAMPYEAIQYLVRE